MKILTIIPARGGSKGVPNKNIKKLNGKPLIQYTIECAEKSSVISEIVVSTDSEEISKIAKKCGAKVLIRDEEFSGDGVPVIPDVVDCVIDQVGDNFDIVLAMEPTYPFRKPETISRVVKKVIKSNYDWVATISKAKEHPYRARILNGDRIIAFTKKDDIFLQRQELPDVYMLRGSVYGGFIHKVHNKKDLKKLEWGGVVIDEKEAIDIDEPLDFMLAEAAINYEN